MQDHLFQDAVTSIGRYIPDTERRIQTQAFWNDWDPVMRRTSHIEPLHNAFKALKAGTQPFENTWTNNVARWYGNVEVFKRLWGGFSAPAKHACKITADMSTLGIRPTVASMGGSAKGMSHRIVENTPFMKKIAGKLYNPSQFDKMKKQLMDSLVPAMDTNYRMMQMGFGNYDSYFSKLSVIADQVNHVGTAFITGVELWDRGITMLAGMRMAAKKGMTPDQAIYGMYDTILKNNFLGREFTPSWLRNPQFKLLSVFQVTPYKIMEKRFTFAQRSKRAITGMGKDIFNASKTSSGREQLLTDLKNIRRDVMQTEQELKMNLFFDALRSEKDFYGNMVVKQFVKDIMITGAATAAAGSVGYNMYHHFFHLPFLKNSEYSDTYATLAVSPAINAILDGSKKYNRKRENDEDSFLLTEILQRWMGKSGPFPDTVSKYNRITDDDIPEIYKDSKFKYLFAIPATKDKD